MTDLNPRPHELIWLEESETYLCATCKKKWKYEPLWMCVGIPVYPGLWDEVWPEGLMTKTQLNAAGYTTGRKLPRPAALLHWSKSPNGDGYLRLYDPAEATPKREMSDGQQAAIKTAQQVNYRNRHCNRCERPVQRYGDQYCHRCDVMRMASDLLNREFVILDSETTGLGPGDEIIQLAIINQAGETLLNSLIKAKHPEAMFHRSGWNDICASDIHGIVPEDLADAPTFVELYPEIVAALQGKTVIVYNEAFDLPMLSYMCDLDDLPAIAYQSSICAMEMFAQFVGDWSHRHGNYRWQQLPGRDHTALGDCRATLDLLRDMAHDNFDFSTL